MSNKAKEFVGSVFYITGFVVLIACLDKEINILWSFLGGASLFVGLDLYIDARIERKMR